MKIRSGRRGARVVGLVAGVALVGGLAATAAPASAAGKPESAGSQAEGVIAGAWIVTLKDGQSPRGVSAEHARNHNAQVDHVYEHALRGYAARMSETAAARVARDSRVAAVVADRVVEAYAPKGGAKPTKPSEPPAPAEPEVPTGVARVGASAASGSDTVTVAIVDSGIDPTHPDLAGSIRTDLSRNCSSGSSWGDGNGHGTHVAGTVGAIRNGSGVVGVAPGVGLAAVRVLDNRGSGSWSAVVCGLNWVTANRAQIQVANMSLGGLGGAGTCTDGGLRQAVCNTVAAGVTVVVAAGNDAKDSTGYVPARYPEVITVSALADSDGSFGSSQWTATCRNDQVEDAIATFSNYGPPVDFISPGVCIRSTWKGGGYNTISGTSMAAPHVAGIAALHVAAGASTPALVLTALTNGATGQWHSTSDTDGSPDLLVQAPSTTTAVQ